MAKKLETKETAGISEGAPILDAEWCYQFFDNEPMIFGYQEEGQSATPLVLQIQPNEGEGLQFTQNGMAFRIFPRPISEATKLERAKEKQKNASKD